MQGRTWIEIDYPFFKKIPYMFI